MLQEKVGGNFLIRLRGASGKSKNLQDGVSSITCTGEYSTRPNRKGSLKIYFRKLISQGNTSKLVEIA